MKGIANALVSIFFCMSLAQIAIVRAQDEEDDPQARLAAMYADVESAEKALVEVLDLETIRMAELKVADDQVKKAAREFSERKKEAQALLERREEIRQISERTAQERDKVLILAKARLKALYMHRDDSFVEWIVAGESPSAVRRTAVYFNRVREFDVQLVAKLRETLARNEDSQAQLASTLKSLEKALATQSAREKELKERSKEQKVLLDSIREQKAEREKTIATLRAQALRLETVVRSFMGGEDQENSRERRKKRHEHKEQPQGVLLPFDGDGLHTQKGGLVWPVKGEIVQRFGKAQVKEFSDVIFNKGVDLKSSEGSEVRAIATGRVIFLGRLPGYGTVVIVDHGKRYYSLYGRLSEVMVTRGEDLQKGATLGKTGLSDQRGSNLYFEIRHNGTPVNPQVYLGKKFR